MSGNKTLKSFKTLLAEAKLPERTVPLCLRGDLVAEHEAVERDLEQAQKAAADSLAGNGVGELVERIEALEAQMQDSTHNFVLRAMPKAAFRAMVADYPPRPAEGDETHSADERMGFNVDDFYPALIRASVVDPELDDDEWQRLNDVLTDNQFSQLAMGALLLNTGEVSVPFSLAASRAKRASADT